MSFEDQEEDDYTLIPRNIPAKGKYMRMDKKEAIIWSICGLAAFFHMFTLNSNFNGIMNVLGSVLFLWFLWYIFSNQIGGRVMWRYVQDLYHTYRAKRTYYFFEGRGSEDIGFTYLERDIEADTEEETDD